MVKNWMSAEEDKGVPELGESSSDALDAVAEQRRIVAAAEAELAHRCLHFADLRIVEDTAALPPLKDRPPGSARPGEFVPEELALALSEQAWDARLLVARARRVRAGLPSVWQASREGALDGERVTRIDKAAKLIKDPDHLALLDDCVVDVARDKTPKQLTHWLQRFLAEHEPEAFEHRRRRAFAERRVVVAQAVNGMGYVTAEVSNIDAAAIDLRLSSLAMACGAQDARSMQQRRSDLLADLVLGRIQVVAKEGTGGPTADSIQPDSSPGNLVEPDSALTPSAQPDADEPSPTEAAADLLEVEIIDPETGELLDTVYRAVGPAGEPLEDPSTPVTTSRAEGLQVQRRAATPPTIGVVVTLESLLGRTETPGLLWDRSASVPAEEVRTLAAAPGTLFYRLLTDAQGNLLDVTETGRFASDRLGFALKVRTGTCGFPTCSVPASACDLHHHQPAPEGPTAGSNMDPACRRNHRGVTHAGFASQRIEHGIEWTTPTSHTYRCLDEPLPVEPQPMERAA